MRMARERKPRLMAGSERRTWYFLRLCREKPRLRWVGCLRKIRGESGVIREAEEIHVECFNASRGFRIASELDQRIKSVVPTERNAAAGLASGRVHR